MDKLETLQDVINEDAKDALLKDIKKFRLRIEEVCNEFPAIATAARFQYSNDPTDKSSIQYLFHKNPVMDQVTEKLLPHYVRCEVKKIIDAVKKISESK